MFSGNVSKINNAFIVSLTLFLTISLFLHTPASAGDAGNIVELWDKVQPPAPVELKAVKLVPAETAFLVLDIEERTCNVKARPRCVASAPAIKTFLQRARQRGVHVVYSLTSVGTPETILPEATPAAGEPVVKSSVDKFFKTELENILRQKGVRTVVIAGTTAEGAVLHTATGAAVRGFQVVVPVDGMSAANLYAEQYTAWHLINAPGTRQRTTLTRFDMIGF